MKTTLTIDQCVAQFLSELQVVMGSIVTYRANLINFFKWCDKSGIDKRNLNRANVTQYWRHVTSNYSSKYARSLIITLKKYYRFLEQYGYDDDFAIGLKCPKTVERFKRHPLTIEDKTKLIEKFSGDLTIQQKRDFLIIKLMLTSGLRCNDISTLSVSDIFQDGDTWCIKIKRKGHYSKDDWIAIDHLWPEIEEYIQELNSNLGDVNYLFISFSRRNKNHMLCSKSIGMIVKRYLSDKYSAHSLRHTAACDLLDAGFDLSDVSAFLGHSSINTTRLYTKIANERKKRKNFASKQLKTALNKSIKV